MRSARLWLKRAAACIGLALLLASAFIGRGIGDEDPVPGPVLPPPAGSIWEPDGSILYPDGTMLFTDGFYVLGSTGQPGYIDPSLVPPPPQ